MNESSIAIREFLTHDFMDKGYEKEFCDVVCRCKGREFFVQTDDEAREALFICFVCGAAYRLLDFGRESVPQNEDPLDCVCDCYFSHDPIFEVVIGVTLHPNSELARTAYVGCKCVYCDRVACYSRWNPEDSPYTAFFSTVKQPIE